MRVTESAIAALEHGQELRVPLAVFFCASVRGEIEQRLEGRDLHPQWDAARKAVDLAGTPIRLVPVVRADPS
jgi:hypothetical protein